MSDALVAQVEAWIADDPDQADRDELTELLDQLPDDDSGEALRELAERFAGPLTFGTAGLRGPLRAGANGMNRAVVSRAAAGLVAYLDAAGYTGPVVIGYDARYRSADFARDTAEIVRGAGREALLLPRQLPTPVLAFAVRRLEAAAGVMVTASHNPPQDNGYKVYLGGPAGLSAQIVPPADSEIQAAIAAVPSVLDQPRDTGYRVLGEDLLDSYLDAVAAIVDPAGPQELVSVATAMHGVGGEILRLAFERAGFAAPSPVAEQDEPDPDFPTVSFPNPEEPGAMDLLLALATEAGADVAIANDPDADRCAIAIPVPAGGWRPLRGDEVGVLLADHLLRRGTTGTYATTIVSSTMLRAMAERHEQPYAETLTGFKWIVRGPLRTGVPLAFGYEEALGYCVAPDVVNDKDGISAALLVAELAAGLRAEGRTVADRLDDLAREYGVYANDQLSFRVDDLDLIAAAMRRMRADLPTELLGQPLAAVDDLLPDADVLVLRGDGLRVVVRPSGTEPKLKCYLEVVVPTRDGNVTNARILAGVRLRTLREEMARLLNV